MAVKNCEEFGLILQAIAKELNNNKNLCKLLHNVNDSPLDGAEVSNIFGKNIRIVPKITGDEEESTIALVLKEGNCNQKNDEYSDISLSIFVYVPLTQWNIKVDGKSNLRPFKIIGEIQKSLYKKSINGIGVITGGDFSLDMLTTDMSCYSVEFYIDVFT